MRRDLTWIHGLGLEMTVEDFFDPMVNDQLRHCVEHDLDLQVPVSTVEHEALVDVDLAPVVLRAFRAGIPVTWSCENIWGVEEPAEALLAFDGRRALQAFVDLTVKPGTALHGRVYPREPGVDSTWDIDNRDRTLDPDVAILVFPASDIPALQEHT